MAEMTLYTTNTAPASLRDAATVLAMRECEGRIEVFMVRRDSRLGFLGGAHVFPGGALDPADAALAATEDLVVGAERFPELRRLHHDPALAKGLLVAAARELFEEAGILLARDRAGLWADLDGDGASAERLRCARVELAAGRGDLAALLAAEELRLDVSGLRFFAHWITPARERKRFDTRFFLVRAPERQSARHCEVESSAGEWLTPSDAFARYRARQIELVPPTIASLETLARFERVDDALRAYDCVAVPCVLPKILIDDSGVTILYPGDEDYDSGVALAPDGRRTDRLVMLDGLWQRP